MFGLFTKKEKITVEEIDEKINEKTLIDEEIKKVDENELIIKPIINKEEEYLKSQYLEIGKDIKNSVEIASKSFFQSKNIEKMKAYSHLYHYLFSLEKYQKDMIKNISYLEFKDKEEQIFTRLKTGYSQYLSKGAPLNDETRRNVDLVFSDIKKLPSKAHRYWYYKIYIWQEAKTKD